jgi:hypothetical protein
MNYYEPYKRILKQHQKININLNLVVDNNWFIHIVPFAEIDLVGKLNPDMNNIFFGK